MAELLRMPEVAANTPDAILSSWLVEVAVPYSAGDAIVTVETEKAVVDVEAESDGLLLLVLAAAGETVEVGAPIAVWGTAGETTADAESLLASLNVVLEGAEPAAESTPAAAALAGEATSKGVATTATGVEGKRLFASPLARKIARDAGLELHAISGSGPQGRIRRIDVDAAIAARANGSAATAAPAVPASPTPVQPAVPAPAPVASLDAEFVDEPNTRVRQAIARRLTQSKQTAPHFYVRGSARVDRLLDLRREINAGGHVKVSLNDLVVKAVATAHGIVPALNVRWNDDSIRHFSGVDVAIAVATDNGLVTPVVRDVDRLSLGGVARASEDLIARARDRRLQQHELEGGSISVTNLGMYGTEDFAAIINPPQAAILAVGAAREAAVVSDGTLVVGRIMKVTLAVDHRPVDGAGAAEWMRAFLELMESPTQILV